jgi:hypothetical protein
MGSLTRKVSIFPDWDFVKADPGLEILKKHGNPPGRDERDLFAYLENCNFKDPDNSSGSKVFWIRREREGFFFANYKSNARPRSGTNFPYPQKPLASQRSQVIQQIVMNIYDRKVGHHQDLKFLKTIGYIDSDRVARFEKSIQISTTLSIVYLLLYRELPDSIATHIEEFTNYIKNFLNGWEVEGKVKNKFTQKWYAFANEAELGSNAEKNLAFAWRTIDYWMRTKSNNPSTDDELIYCHKTLNEVLAKIIYFSNSRIV